MLMVEGRILHMEKDAPEYATMRIWARTLKKLRVISALRGERLVKMLDRWADDELQRLRDEGHQIKLPESL